MDKGGYHKCLKYLDLREERPQITTRDHVMWLRDAESLKGAVTLCLGCPKKGWLEEARAGVSE